MNLARFFVTFFLVLLTSRILHPAPELPQPESKLVLPAVIESSNFQSEYLRSEYKAFLQPCVGIVGDGVGARGGRHKGVDIAVQAGTPVQAGATGQVVKLNDSCPAYGSLASGCGGRGGNYVVVQYANGLFGRYLHLLPGLPVRVGQAVQQGQLLGLVGSSGRSSGPHLHWELRKGRPLGRVLKPSDVGVQLLPPQSGVV
ncbi:M23 family metallopeptidase [Leptolyngbya sp. FACHB-261]|uniref:M23 family metallopeptidase n=1 Tax=Leptolyngbya sp. FACHB-261 TaxID=2692806 RepID=UPI001687737C|nr:M23 family metallopeptidase [Leptolyngbya sp. FACHB-261]MBD2100067.1 M23 family metallopeptidase [Leptolyngbya sp. FACHB-261]